MSSQQSTVNSPQPAERPILFQTEMVKAILEGRKTQTRRTKGLNSVNVEPWFWNREGNPMKKTVRFWDSTKELNPNPLAIHFGFKDPFNDVTYVDSTFGKPGDLLWLRETWCFNGHYHLFKTDHIEMPFRWKPSIHMPKSASRIWLMIEDIRVERVQEISEGDARAEGISHLFPIGHPAHEPETFTNYTWHGRSGDDSFSGYSNTETAKKSFQSLWYSINGEESWKANPWVWVIQFRVLSTTGKPSEEVIQTNYKEVREKGFDSAQPDKRKEVTND